ncbi:unnamed protein product [Adineta steineri]|uniref:Uncharacterized protein n=1 Tax=Adineta steineri TaxID=433720 RepID=A0A818YXS0_9BILA|nr:unnamed protein product [Adineta steineri]
MEKRSTNASAKSQSTSEKKMRYYISHPPKKAITLIDIDKNVLVHNVIEFAKRKFGLKVHGSDTSKISIVLSYRGLDLKPKWCISDLSIPSGAIIQCVYREQKIPDLNIYCGYDKKTLKLFDTSITGETKIGTIRRIISNKLGLPLSTFCLETYTGTQRLYDDMKLNDYDIKMHEHIYLKVWHGFEKFIAACVKGFLEPCSPDDLTRHYQVQVALHIAAFYGHMALTSSVLRQGARSDRPVGEPPSRQWSSRTTINMFPEMLKCPIHIAIERGHVILVDLLVRNSILCTQTRDPVTGFLPYRIALTYSSSSKSPEEKRCYNSIYFYLYNKQYNLKIPLNANGEFVTNLLTSAISTNAVYRPSSHHVNISLPFYCRIISWCERAREKTWKKYGGQNSTVIQTKRIYPEQGLLGYKVLIDGYNNTFEIPSEQLQLVRSDRGDRYITLTDEEREKLIHTKALMKQFSSDERRHFKQVVAAHIHQSTLSPIGSPANIRKNSAIVPHDTQITRPNKLTLDGDNSSITNVLPTANNIIQIQDKSKATTNIFRPTSRITVSNEKDKQTLPMITSLPSNASSALSTLTDDVESVINNTQEAFQKTMSSADAYLLSSARLSREMEQYYAARKRELLTQIEQSVHEQQHSPEGSISQSITPLSNSRPITRSSIVDVDARLPLPDQPVSIGSSSIKSHLDLEVYQSTIKAYERYSSASTRSTAINCLQEANHFKNKPWMKQVEISKEIVKHKVQRRIGRADETDKKSPLLPHRTSATPTASPRHKSHTAKAN